MASKSDFTCCSNTGTLRFFQNEKFCFLSLSSFLFSFKSLLSSSLSLKAIAVFLLKSLIFFFSLLDDSFFFVSVCFLPPDLKIDFGAVSEFELPDEKNLILSFKLMGLFESKIWLNDNGLDSSLSLVSLLSLLSLVNLVSLLSLVSLVSFLSLVSLLYNQFYFF